MRIKKEGEYTVVLLSVASNRANANGEFFEPKTAEAVVKRFKGVHVFCEVGMPNFKVFDSPEAMMARALIIDQANVGAVVSNLRTEHAHPYLNEEERKKYPEDSLAILADLKPTGAFATRVEKLLANDDPRALTFGYRGLSKDCRVEQIISWSIIDPGNKA